MSFQRAAINRSRGSWVPAALVLIGVLAILALVGPGTQHATADSPACQSNHDLYSVGGCYQRAGRWEERCNPGNVRKAPNPGSLLHFQYNYGTGILQYNVYNGVYVGPQCTRPGSSFWNLTPQGWASWTTIIQTN